MSLPIVIQILGMHGVGKTTVAAKAAELFAIKGLRVATLDVDNFSRAFLAKRVDPRLSEESYRKLVFDIADSVKDQIDHQVGLHDTKTTNANAIKAVRFWMASQDVDVILLELHWPIATRYYRDRNEVWLVTGSPENARAHLERYEESRIDGSLALVQKHWRHNFVMLPNDKRYLPNAAMDIDVIHERITYFIECLYHRSHRLPSAPN